MNRQSMAAQVEVSAAVQTLVKELKRLRHQHGFGRVSVELSNTDNGTKSQVKIEMATSLHFGEDGELLDAGGWEMKEIGKVGQEMAQHNNAQEP